MSVDNFPFGQPVERVVQVDRGTKRVFVLGVYSSAVHAHWLDADGSQIVAALAVASEPYIFWRGDGVEDILSRIDIPTQAGRLEPAASHLNGPSGRSLDEQFLAPLGLTREDAWLCDLVPYSCMNGEQANAVRDRYAPLEMRLNLPAVSWRPVPKELATTTRRSDIVGELRKSAASVVITLGDDPLRWFAAAFGSKRSLRAYGKNLESYGRLHDLQIAKRKVKLLPLVHPRHAAGLGFHSRDWKSLHGLWVSDVAPDVLQN